MKVVSLTTVFPNAAQPTHGVFVFQRLRHLARIADLRVVAPVSWRVRGARAVPSYHEEQGLKVSHPWFLYVPGVLKIFDGVCLFVSALASMQRLRKTFDFDVIDAHFAFPEGCAAALFSAWYRRPFTITMRGTEIPLSRYVLRRKAIAWALRRAQRVIAVAEPLADHAISLGVSPDRVTVIANGVDTDTFRSASRAAARQALGLDIPGPLVVSVGHLSARKGFQRVLRIWPDLLRRHPGATFAIIGGPGAEPSNKATLEALVRQLRVDERVIFAGPQPPATVSQWLTAADLFVLASDYEGCPNVVLEALACGRPVVATRVGNVDRMVPPYAGVLVDRPDDDERLLEAVTEALRRRWETDRIRAYAEGLSWRDVAARVAEEWRQAATEASRVTSRRHHIEIHTP